MHGGYVEQSTLAKLTNIGEVLTKAQPALKDNTEGSCPEFIEGLTP